MDTLLALFSLVLLMVIAYRGYSVILFAPIAAMVPLLLTHPGDIPAAFSGIFMEKAITFVKLYFPILLMGAVFGKLIEVSGFARSIIGAIVTLTRGRMAVFSIVIASAILTYGGVSLFVVVFAIYPFAAGLFRQAGIPKRLIPATLTLGALSFTMDALPGTPQIQNIIPTTFFGTTAWAAPTLGTVGALFILVTGTAYLQWRVAVLHRRGETYGDDHVNEPTIPPSEGLPHPLIAVLPLVTVVVLTRALSVMIPHWMGDSVTVALPGMAAPMTFTTAAMTGIWALEGALFAAILLTIALRWRLLLATFADTTRPAIAGALLATMNVASEYGFGGVIAALPGFLAVRDFVGGISNPLVSTAVVTNVLAGITGSASGGLSIALASMGSHFADMARAAHIPMEVVHRVSAMASGGMDNMPHNGAIITALTVCGLTHRQSYKDIFVIAVFKTLAVFFVIAVYYATDWV
jgi:H+/gluconate symporter-like permease